MTVVCCLTLTPASYNGPVPPGVPVVGRKIPCANGKGPIRARETETSSSNILEKNEVKSIKTKVFHSFFFLYAPNNFDFPECPSPVGGQSLPHLLYCDITSGDHLDACHHTGGFSLAVVAGTECVDLQGSACWRGLHRHVSNPYL